MKKIFILLAAAVMCACALAGCRKSGEPIPLTYYDQMTEGQDYNRTLFYRNDLPVHSADPSIIYITEGGEEGYFYLYATSDLLACRGIMAWRSRDMNNWEAVGVVFKPEAGSWGMSSIWAPQILYDEADGTYYLFYSANNTNAAGGYTEMKYLGLCTSQSPAGPFVQWTGTNQNEDIIGLGDPIFDLEKIDHENPLYRPTQSFIDACPYIDPVTGDKYLYMCRSRYNAPNNDIWGVKMKDWATPDYATVAQLTTCNRTTVGGTEETDLPAGYIDEGPFMYYAHGKYYLLFSINATTEKNYAVCQAIGDTPLGPFTKVQNSDGGLVLGADLDWDHVSCAGHCSLIDVGNELWIVYHQDLDREFGASMRGIAIDKVVWVQNPKGQYVMQAVGPTYSLQPLPAVISGYGNIAGSAQITVENMKEGSNAAYLNDGLVKLHDISLAREFEAKAGITTIKLTFEDYVAARAILIYNSYDYEKSFAQIARIDFGFKKDVDGVEFTGTAYIENLKFDFERYANTDAGMMRVGAAAVAEFDELLVKDITITLSSPAGAEGVNISEIAVIGK